MKKTLRIYAIKPQNGDLKEIKSLDAFHFSVGSILGDGAIPKEKNKTYLEMEQASPTYAKWKWEKCLELKLCYIRQGA